jgi:hypothetical protein
MMGAWLGGGWNKIITAQGTTNRVLKVAETLYN